MRGTQNTSPRRYFYRQGEELAEASDGKERLELAGAEVGDRFVDLLGRVHHERAVASNRLL
jgi:hypothetical protein